MEIWILGGYLLVGLASAAGFRATRPQPSHRFGGVLAMALLWPFLLPFRGTGSSGTPDRVEEIAQRVRRDWSPAASGPVRADAREARLLEGFVSRLKAERARIAEMDGALAQAPESVRERLARLREVARADWEKNVQLLEELAAQLTLLRFASAGRAGAGAERAHVQELLARIEAVVEVSGGG